MADVIRALKEERAVLIDKIDKIDQAIAVLDDGPTPKPARNGRRRSGSSTAGSGAKKSQRSGRRSPDRAAQLKRIVKKSTDGLRPSEVAKEMKVSQAQAHGVIKRLTERGELTKVDGKVKLA